MSRCSQHLRRKLLKSWGLWREKRQPYLFDPLLALDRGDAR